MICGSVAHTLSISAADSRHGWAQSVSTGHGIRCEGAFADFELRSMSAGMNNMRLHTVSSLISCCPLRCITVLYFLCRISDCKFLASHRARHVCWLFPQLKGLSTPTSPCTLVNCTPRTMLMLFLTGFSPRSYERWNPWRTCTYEGCCELALARAAIVHNAPRCSSADERRRTRLHSTRFFISTGVILYNAGHGYADV